MITTVASVALPVDEKLRIQKNRIEPEKDTGIKKTDQYRDRDSRG